MKLKSLLTAEELSLILDISEFTVKKLARTKQLPTVYAGRQPKFDLYKVLKFFQQLEGGAA
jgi:hypothetical protein